MYSNKLLELYKQLTDSEAKTAEPAPMNNDVQDIDYNSLPAGSQPTPQEPSLFERISSQTRKQEQAGNVGAPEPTPSPSAPKATPQASSEIAEKADISSAAPQALRAPMFQATLDPYGAELNDQALKDAYEAKRQGDLTSALLKSAAKLGSGISGAVSGGKRPDDSIDTSGIEKLAGSSLEEIQGRRAGKKDEVSFDKARTELGDNKALSDPNSSISQMTVSMLKNMGVNVPPGVSAAQLKAGGIDVDRMMNAKEAAEQRKETARMFKEERTLNREALSQQRNIQNIEKLQQNYNKDKVVANANEGISAADMAASLLDSDTPIADAAIKRQLSRLSGEVGVMTDKDVSDFGGSQALQARLAQSIKTMNDGRLTKENKQFMRQVISVMRKRREEQLKERAEFYSKQGSKRLGVPVEEVMGNILPGYDTIGSPGMVKVREISTGKTGSIPSSELEKALKSGEFERI
jgi:hypothetical protein